MTSKERNKLLEKLKEKRLASMEKEVEIKDACIMELAEIISVQDEAITELANMISEIMEG